MSEEKFKLKKDKTDKPLTGVPYIITNPIDGANINAPNISNGFHLKLSVGEKVVADETIAKNAKYVYGFLYIKPAPITKEYISPVEDEEFDDEDGEQNGPVFPEDERLDVDKYSFPELRKIAFALKIENVVKLKHEDLKARLFNFNLASIKPTIKETELPLYIIK